MTLFFALIANLGSTQTNNNNFSFKDFYGNNITVTNYDKLPAPFDTTFFKLNLTGLYFNKELTEKPIRFDYTLSDIKWNKKKNEVEFSLSIIPDTNEIEEVLKYLGGPRHYSMKVLLVNNKLRIDEIKFLYGEI
ncbi:MAG: hypothetical protein ACEQSR_13550 [Candidatus Methylacidiphilales bacterium]